MADRRAARRDAGKAAKELLSGTYVVAAEDLGEAHAASESAVAGIDDARRRGAELVKAAQQQAAQLESGAVDAVTAAKREYALKWDAARQAGWTPAQLRGMGYTAPKATKVRSPRAADPVAAAAIEDPSETGAGTTPPVEQVPEPADA